MRIITYIFILAILAVKVQAQVAPVTNTYTTDQGLPRLNIERSMVFVPQETWLYSHHPSIISFKGKLIALWSNGLKDEDSPGQRVVYAVSKDMKQWSKPMELASPSKYNDTLNVLTAAGMYEYKGTLVAYYGEYTLHRTQTKLWAKTTTDGEHWSKPKDLNLPVIPNHGPQKLKSGRLLICGNFSYPYSDDPTGLSGWKMNSFYDPSLYTQDNPSTFYAPAQKNGFPPLCEGSYFQTPDSVIHLLMRVTGKGWKGKLWLTQSNDNAQTWTKPIETQFSDNDSKFHFGQLPDGRFYYVGIPDTLHHYDRNPLILTISKDGKVFDKSYVIANELYHLRTEGLWKGGQYGYPHTIIHQGYMYVIISRQKEAVEVIRFKLNQLER
ncbi:exo-alpha-sialidase [Mucilaginibacter daejeonensis]|uniref:exo-alpha-sialidase n=1 Tax=Mucilaginibacter daejeonensis TaxID=398049 RepID=UPI001D16FD03|nr:exo-alpha-sialidase [Mucilaginibacter daejeonensis]UEG54087.1 exo-alpha-sialidase [Mucilaginibacter daejeonensis]